MGLASSSGYAEQEVLVNVKEEIIVEQHVEDENEEDASKAATSMPRRGSSVRRSIVVVEGPDDGYGVSDDEDLPHGSMSEMSSLRECLFQSDSEADDDNDELAADAIVLPPERKDFREQDPSVFTLLDYLGVQPQPGIGALQVIELVLPFCGMSHSYYPRIDHFVMRILHNAKEEVQNVAHEWRDDVGNNLLMRACLSKSIVLATFLVETTKFDPGFARSGTGETSLHVATRNGLFVLTEMLLRHGAPHSPSDRRLRTPLHYAAASGDATTVALLLLYGADPRRQDESGKTAIDYALMREDAKDCVSLLHTHSHWVAYQDRRSGRTFYENSVTKETTFQRPLNVTTDMASVVHEATKTLQKQEPQRARKRDNDQDQDQDGAKTASGRAAVTAAAAAFLSGRSSARSSGTTGSSNSNNSIISRRRAVLARMKTWRDLAWREGIRKASQRRHIRSLQAVREYQERVLRGEAAVMTLNESEVSKLRAELSAVVSDQRIKEDEMENLRERLERERSAREKIALALQEARNKVEEAQRARSDAAAKESADAEALASRLAKLEADLAAKAEENERLKNDVRTERELRRKTHNQHIDLLGAIRVFCRIRPINAREKTIAQQKPQTKVPAVLPANEATLGGDPDTCAVPSKDKNFPCDACFGPRTSQAEVFEQVEPLVQSCVDGFNVCVFAYGQTGSGKSYTMFGPNAGGGAQAESQGIAPRSVYSLFALLNENVRGRPGSQATVSCYGVELYNNQLRDLLAEDPGDQGGKLKIRKDRAGSVCVEGVRTETVTDAKAALALMATMQSKRVVAATKMNAESSRSHFVYCLLIESTSAELKARVKGKLTLVDLAGSEKVDQSGVTGQGLKEAVAINQSLTALGDVISALTSKAKFVPYRNNILTQLMQDSIGGNAKTLMFINVSPSSDAVAETVNSLQYGTRVKQIRNRTAKNLETEEIRELRQQLHELQQRVAAQGGSSQ
ncbi:Kinesin, putative [Hondaea fermentalgiana]|uniref:Kinesin-like protein n=1 Tax=Hondaea fermentalgiana TaxID=2315210 RepID=A0A2R5GDM8_9STRA|nr:Kinesin, putative [Hondaea fermentalgiana]|eukprot:GBG29057.1 Kinesin, putative [Hondaea fermentalgiana]